MSVTIEFISEEVNMDIINRKNLELGRKTDKKNYRQSEELTWVIHIYTYKIFFNPVNPELGTVPSRTNKIFKNRILNLSNPG